MALTTEQKTAVRIMTLASGDSDYAAQVGADDTFALSELAKFAAKRVPYATNQCAEIDGVVATRTAEKAKLTTEIAALAAFVPTPPATPSIPSSPSTTSTTTSTTRE